MNKIQLKKFIGSLVGAHHKELVIRVHSKDFKRGITKSRQIMEQFERNVRIQKLELAVRKLNLSRSWV